MRFNTQKVVPLPGDALPPNHYTGSWIIEREPMLYQANVDFAYGAGGPLTKTVLDNLRAMIPQQEFADLRVDTRSHMLMAGMYPCIPGWHCDSFLEGDEQRRLYTPLDPLITNYMYLSGEPATLFLVGRDVECPVTERNHWGDVSKWVEAQGLATVAVPTGQLVRFQGNELHRGAPHTGSNGHWRFFLRATSFPEGHQQRRKWANKVRSQVQVYADVNAGW